MMIDVRPARSDEAAALTELALRAKASWGYDQAFMAAVREELTLTAARLALWTVWVAEVDGRTAGMIALNGAELEDFFVEPDLQGRGVGGALLAALLAECRARGVRAIELDADPHAETIYARFGFRTVGRSRSGSIPGRWLPRMRFDLAGP